MIAQASPGSRLASAWLAALLLGGTLSLACVLLGITGNPFDEKRLLTTTLLLCAVALLLLVPALRREWQAQLAALPRHLSWTLLIIALLGLISAWRATLPWAAVTELALWVVLLAALAGVAVLRRVLGDGFELAMLGLLALIMAIYLLLFGAYLLQALAGQRELDLRLFFINFSLQRFFNQFQTWTLPLAVLPLLYAQQRGWTILQWVLAVAAANWWALLFLTGGRGTLLAVVVAILWIGWLLRGRVKDWLKWQGATLVGGLLIFWAVTWLVIPHLGKVVTNPPLLRATLSSRGVLWEKALAMIASHPLLGVGPMHYACRESTLAAHPHNALLQVAAEWGIPAALLLTLLLLWLYKRAVVALRQQGPVGAALDTSPALLATLVAATLYAQLDGVIVMPISQLMLVVIGGWSWAALAKPVGEASRWRLSHTVWSVALLLAISVLAHRLAPVWGQVIRGEYSATAAKGVYLPRFWADGQICREGTPWQH